MYLPHTAQYQIVSVGVVDVVLVLHFSLVWKTIVAMMWKILGQNMGILDGANIRILAVVVGLRVVLVVGLALSLIAENHTQVQRNKSFNNSFVATMLHLKKEDNLVDSSAPSASPSITTQQRQCLLDLHGTSTTLIAHERLSGESSNFH